MPDLKAAARTRQRFVPTAARRCRISSGNRLVGNGIGAEVTPRHEHSADHAEGAANRPLIRNVIEIQVGGSGHRFLVGQPENQVVFVSASGERVVLVLKQRFFAWAAAAAIGEFAFRRPYPDGTGSSHDRKRNASSPRRRSASRGHARSTRLVGGRVVAAAIFGHAHGQHVPLAAFAELHRPARCGLCRRVELRFVAGRAAGPGDRGGRAVSTSLASFANSRMRVRVTVNLIVLIEPSPGWRRLQGKQRVVRVGGGGLTYSGLHRRAATARPSTRGSRRGRGSDRDRGRCRSDRTLIISGGERPPRRIDRFVGQRTRFCYAQRLCKAGVGQADQLAYVHARL